MTRPGQKRPLAKKRFGQNFLRDPAVLARIVSAIRPETGDLMLEIGPGQGALTSRLLEHVPVLHAVEIDRDLQSWLRNHFDTEQLQLHEADILDFDLSTVSSEAGSLRIVGNLPYNISTEIMFRLLKSLELIRDMHFMLQKEVVDRMTASPGSKRYGRLSVMLQHKCEISALFDIPPEAFVPQPKVTSTLVRLQPLPEPKGVLLDENHFALVVRTAFSQRRKTLRNALKALLPATLLESVGIDPTRRAENLELEEFVRLSNAFSQQAASVD